MKRKETPSMASKSQPVGTPVDPRSPQTTHYAVEPSGSRGDSSRTADPGPSSGRSDTLENADGCLQPSLEDVN